MRRTPEQVAAAHHLRTVARRGDAGRTAKAREIKQQAGAGLTSRAILIIAVGYLLTALVAAGVGFALAEREVPASFVGAGSCSALAAGTALSNRAAGLRRTAGAR